VRRAEEVARTGEAVAVIFLRFDVVVSCLFMDEDRFRDGGGPLLRNFRRDGIAA
jgi:hypothetical protein